jgi:hypothetical protein
MVIMAGTVLWAGTFTVLGMMRHHTVSGKLAKEKQEVRLFADAQRHVVAGIRLHPRERMVLDHSTMPWPRDPLLQRSSGIRPAEARVQNFVYSGFITVGNQSFAIINGHEYRVNERVAASDFIVETIQPDRVVLISGSGGRRVLVAMQSNNAKRESL